MALHAADALTFDPVANSHTENGSLSAAVTITPSTGATKLLLQALTQNIRFTIDGTTPTASKGFQLADGEMRVIPIGGNTVIKVIEETASADIEYVSGI